jgi:RimJ/RimL family protein N-acetyltransferase
MASGRDEIELGWVIVPDRWGEGLATELARVSLEVAFGPLALEEVIAYTQPDNLASRRVMEKSGFIYEHEITYLSQPFVLYRRGHASEQPFVLYRRSPASDQPFVLYRRSPASE